MNTKNFSKEQINDMNNIIKNIIDIYLIDLYGELNEDSKKHLYSRERIELLMKSAYHKGYDLGNVEGYADALSIEQIPSDDMINKIVNLTLAWNYEQTNKEFTNNYTDYKDSAVKYITKYLYNE